MNGWWSVPGVRWDEQWHLVPAMDAPATLCHTRIPVDYRAGDPPNLVVYRSAVVDRAAPTCVPCSAVAGVA